MAFVRVSADRTWIAEPGMLLCPQIPEVELSDDPYFTMDFSKCLDQDTKISSVSTPTEVDSKTVTISDESVSNDGRSISFKATGQTPAGIFNMSVEITLSSGTSQTLTKRGKFRAV